MAEERRDLTISLAIDITGADKIDELAGKVKDLAEQFENLLTTIDQLSTKLYGMAGGMPMGGGVAAGGGWQGGFVPAGGGGWGGGGGGGGTGGGFYNAPVTGAGGAVTAGERGSGGAFDFASMVMQGMGGAMVYLGAGAALGGAGLRRQIGYGEISKMLGWREGHVNPLGLGDMSTGMGAFDAYGELLKAGGELPSTPGKGGAEEYLRILDKYYKSNGREANDLYNKLPQDERDKLASMSIEIGKAESDLPTNVTRKQMEDLRGNVERQFKAAGITPPKFPENMPANVDLAEDRGGEAARKAMLERANERMLTETGGPLSYFGVKGLGMQYNYTDEEMYRAMVSGGRAGGTRMFFQDRELEAGEWRGRIGAARGGEKSTALEDITEYARRLSMDPAIVSQLVGTIYTVTGVNPAQILKQVADVTEKGGVVGMQDTVFQMIAGMSTALGARFGSGNAGFNERGAMAANMLGQGWSFEAAQARSMAEYTLGYESPLARAALITGYQGKNPGAGPGETYFGLFKNLGQNYGMAADVFAQSLGGKYNQKTGLAEFQNEDAAMIYQLLVSGAFGQNPEAAQFMEGVSYRDSRTGKMVTSRDIMGVTGRPDQTGRLREGALPKTAQEAADTMMNLHMVVTRLEEQLGGLGEGVAKLTTSIVGASKTILEAVGIGPKASGNRNQTNTRKGK